MAGLIPKQTTSTFFKVTITRMDHEHGCEVRRAVNEKSKQITRCVRNQTKCYSKLKGIRLTVIAMCLSNIILFKL